MAAEVADGAGNGAAPVAEPVRLLDVAHRQAPAAPHGVEPTDRELRQERHGLFAAIHARRFEQQHVVEAPGTRRLGEAAARRRGRWRTANGSRAARCAVERLGSG